jgi:hypothetical protein
LISGDSWCSELVLISEERLLHACRVRVFNRVQSILTTLFGK